MCLTVAVTHPINLMSRWHTDLAIAAGRRMLSQSPRERQAFSGMILSSAPVSHNATFVF